MKKSSDTNRSSLTSCERNPREVFADPITDRASAIIVAHNHPSGSLAPSMEDKEITAQLESSGETLGIRLLDHIIFNHKWISSSTTTSNTAWGGRVPMKIRKNRCFSIK